MSIQMKTISDIVNEAGITYHTLVKYTGLGLLPKPQRVWRGRKGSESLYPDNVIELIDRIKEERDSGLTLRQIAENSRIERATDAFTDVIKKYPDYHFTHGEIVDEKKESEGSIEVTVKMVGLKRR